MLLLHKFTASRDKEELNPMLLEILCKVEEPFQELIWWAHKSQLWEIIKWQWQVLKFHNPQFYLTTLTVSSMYFQDNKNLELQIIAILINNKFLSINHFKINNK